MDNQFWDGMSIIKEILAAMNRTGKSQAEEERIRQIMRGVIAENATSSASEKDLVQRMMQLLEQNMTKQTAELQATAQERDKYKAKMEELNRSMDQLMKNEGAHASEGEGSGLTARQRKLAEMLDELKEMRESKRSEQRAQRKPCPRGGDGGVSGDYGARKPQYQGQAHGAFSKFSRQNKGEALFDQGKHPFSQNEGKSREKFDVIDHEDCKPGGFQGKPFQRKQYQKYPEPFQKLPQYGKSDGSPHFSNWVSGHDHGSQFDNRPRQYNTGPEIGDTSGMQNMRMQDQGPNRGSFQPRGQFYNRGQFQQPRGQFHPHRGQFQQHRGQFHNYGHGQRSDLSEPSKEFNYSQFSPEEIEAIKAVLKQQQQEKDRKPGSTPLVVNPSKTAFKKKKQKKPKDAKNMIPDDSDDSEEEDNEESDVKSSENDGKSADLGATSDTATGGKSVTDTKKKKKNKKKNKESKDQAASEQKLEDLSALELFVASSDLDLSQTSDLNMDDKVKDIMLIGKEGEKIVTCQPQTVKELIEFKQKCPNAQVVIVKASEQK